MLVVVPGSFVLTPVDGYGLPFPPDAQERHRQAILTAKGDETFQPTVGACEEIERDKPAGWWPKENKTGSGL